MLGTAWSMVKQTVYEFIDDSALSRAGAIAYFTLFSLAPIIVIVVAIAGFVFGEDAAQGALSDQLRGLMGQQSADLVQSMVQGASNTGAGVWATVFGIVVLLVTSTGVFSELQADLNAVWKAQASSDVVSAMVKTRAISLGLVAALGFLLLVSLVISALLAGLAHYVNRIFPGADVLLQIANFVVSFALITVMFAAIYKVLPDKPLNWHDVGVGAVVTAFLFTVGKVLIGLYIGRTAVASSYGAAGTAIVLLLWIYYSAVIFLLGAEFTKVYARQNGNPFAPPEPGTVAAQPAPAAAATPAAVPHRRPLGALDAIAAGALVLAILRQERRRRRQPRSWIQLLRGG
jgi:membrane protein